MAEAAITIDDALERSGLKPGTVTRSSLSVIEAMPGNNDLSRPGPGRLQELLQSEPMRTRAVLQPFGDDVLRDAFTLKPGVIQDVYGLLQNAKRNPGGNEDRMAKKAKKAKTLKKRL